MKSFIKLAPLLLTCFLLAACSGKETQTDTKKGEKSDTQQSSDDTEFFEEVTDVKIDHIHGMGYAGNQNEVYIATHDGLVKYLNNKWYLTSKNNHDYMGFQAINKGFYSSGHPEPGSNLENPLGLIKSTDAGESFKKLAFYGETDFHYLAAGFNSHTIYAINESPNSQLESGLYYSEDEGSSWKRSKMEGNSSNSIGNIAAHPTQSNMIGISTDKGLFLSDNYGDLLQLVSEPTPITTLEFQEDSILYSAFKEDTVTLFKQELTTQKVIELSLPSEVSQKNPVLYVASNPNNREEITIVTYKNDIYQTKDNGSKWQTLIANGEKQ